MEKVIRIAALAIVAATLPARADPVTTQGYYAGLSTLYPYKPVYCDNDTGMGKCYGSPGDIGNLPKSAPLPESLHYCVWADRSDPRAKVDMGNGWAGLTGEGWYQWLPRDTDPKRVQFVGAKVCYLEDRGKPKNLNDLKRDKEKP